MYIYDGKTSFFRFAVNEHITMVFPCGFALHDPVYACWQWTVDAQGRRKSNTTFVSMFKCLHYILTKGRTRSKRTTIHSVTHDSKFGCKFSFTGNYYTFDATIANGDFSEITALMRCPDNTARAPTVLSRQYGDSKPVPAVSVYSGKINFPEEAENEHVALVIPFGISSGAPVGLYFQWSTETWNHKEKQNHQVNATFRDVTASEQEIKGTFDDGDYKFEVTIGCVDGRETLPVIIMSNWAGTTSSSTLSFREGSFHAPKQPVNKKVI